MSYDYHAENGHMPSYSHPQIQPTQMRVPTVGQPSYQPFPGPTASEDGGFYGPYWPDGSYVPYRPAAIRKSEYQRYSQQDFDNFDHLNNKFRDDSFAQFRGGQHHVDGINANHSQASAYVQRYDTRYPDTASYYHVPDLRDRDPSSEGRHHVHQEPQSQTHGFEPKGLATPTPRSSSHSARTQFKEKVLSWAHSVYVQLLACLQQQQKAGGKHGRNGRRILTKSSLYPKPPRQPASTLGGPDLTGTFDSDAKSSLPYGTEESQINVTSALANAQKALEMLESLCEESDWKWIDGMLLGGCLAYGLERYGDAHDWYLKIIKLDPRFGPHSM